MKKILLLCSICISQLLAGIIHPPDGGKLSYVHIMFEWEAIEDATAYEFELSDSNDFSSRLISSEVADVRYLVTDQINWESTYYWRVKAVGDNWIGTYSFTTGSTRSNVTITWHGDESLYSDGNTIFGSADGYYSAIIDRYGNEIWNSGSDNIIYYNFFDNGQFFGAQYTPSNTYEYIGTEFSLTGSEGVNIIWQEPNEEFVHHEFMELPWGDYMGIAHMEELGPILATGLYQEQYWALGYQADGVSDEFSWSGDRLVIWDNVTQDILWTWSTFDHFNISDYDSTTWNSSTPLDDGYYDWTHVNAFYFDDRDNSILISTRNLSRITKIQYPSGDIIWNMGRESVSGDVTFGHNLDFSYQHSISLTDADNILIFDNGWFSVEYWGASSPTSRALAISVSGDPGNYSASLAFEYILPNNYYGLTSGNTQQLENGNYLITTMGNNGTTLEVTSSGTLVWEANYASAVMWRANRISQCSALGDLNGDSIWNVLDIVQLANCVLSQNCGELPNGCAGDFNNDDVWNVLDVVQLANCVLSQNCDG